MVFDIWWDEKNDNSYCPHLGFSDFVWFGKPKKRFPQDLFYYQRKTNVYGEIQNKNEPRNLYLRSHIKKVQTLKIIKKNRNNYFRAKQNAFKLEMLEIICQYKKLFLVRKLFQSYAQ